MNADRLNRINISVAAFFIFAICGTIIRFFISSIEIFPLSGLFYQLSLFAIPFGIFGSVLAYIFPKPIGSLMSLIVGLGGS
jgi:hypothetical protein